MARLKRTLGLPTLLFYGVGVIVGAGIYSILGAAAGEAGRAVWLSLVLSSVPAFLAALCYAELSTMFPRAGAAYVYVREALPGWPWASFTTGWVVAVTVAATAATVAIAFGGYLSLFAPMPPWASALLLLAGCTAVNIAGIRESTWVTIGFTTIEIGGLMMIVALGFASGRVGEGVLEIKPGPVLTAAALSFFMFTGFEGLANLSEEVKKPERNLPLAILISLAVTATLYVLVALAAVALVEPEELAASDSPLATAAAAASPVMATALGWIALFSTANTALITLVVGSRLLYGMADEGQMPAALSRTLTRRQTPWVAALVVGAGAAALLPLGGVEVVGSVSSLTTLAVFAAVAGALIVLRVQRPEVRGKFRLPLTVGRVPVVPVLAVAAVVALMMQFEPEVYLVAAGAVAAGPVVWWTRRWWGQAPARTTRAEGRS